MLLTHSSTWSWRPRPFVVAKGRCSRNQQPSKQCPSPDKLQSTSPIPAGIGGQEFLDGHVLQKVTFSGIVPLTARGMVHSCEQNRKPFSSAAHIKFEHHRRTIPNGIANYQQLYVFPRIESCHYAMPAPPRILKNVRLLTDSQNRKWRISI